MPNLRCPDPFFDNAEGRNSYLMQNLAFYQDHCRRGAEAERLACSLINRGYSQRWPEDVSRALYFEYGGQRVRYPKPLCPSLAEVRNLPDYSMPDS